MMFFFQKSIGDQGPKFVYRTFVNKLIRTIQKSDLLTFLMTVRIVALKILNSSSDKQFEVSGRILRPSFELPDLSRIASRNTISSQSRVV